MKVAMVVEEVVAQPGHQAACSILEGSVNRSSAE